MTDKTQTARALVERFTLVDNYPSECGGAEMELDDEGDWVHVDTLTAALDRAEKAEAERDCLAALHGEDMALCTQLQHDAEDARAAGYAQGVRDAAGWCSDEADRCDDAVNWGGSRQYVSDCKAASFALRNANAKILALLPAAPALGIGGDA